MCRVSLGVASGLVWGGFLWAWLRVSLLWDLFGFEFEPSPFIFFWGVGLFFFWLGLGLRFLRVSWGLAWGPTSQAHSAYDTGHSRQHSSAKNTGQETTKGHWHPELKQNNPKHANIALLRVISTMALYSADNRWLWCFNIAKKVSILHIYWHMSAVQTLMCIF